MEVRAVTKYVGISPQKTRWVIDQVRGMDAEDMYIAKITADGAPVRRWRRFGARGRFKPIIRRSSHITVVLDERQ